MVNFEGTWRTVTLTQQYSTYPVIGVVKGIKADGEWHSASFNLLDMLKKASPKATSYLVKSLALGDPYGSRNSAGVMFHIDNFVLFGPGKPQPEFEWSSLDITGISGYSLVADQSPQTEPDKAAEGPVAKLALSDLKPGLWYLHVRAQDNAGNWGPAMHYPYFVP